VNQVEYVLMFIVLGLLKWHVLGRDVNQMFSTLNYPWMNTFSLHTSKLSSASRPAS
jgi:hypothetical protein